ncbi:hypothetical protein RH915_03350 [Serpentinicella sp. ANB-PHB4]|uniref:hypothetical protein n=1 Tax=Serpentinicella sp. ANB-PHB4 TaxID=3074076 RepID=UPI002865F9E6|nr:hypothetical protein [Serpentinicella sp. ANB-PHB4]MDR5658519.1 hypothetical protein [Serpentinicella sp. ANB-PHB4]
MITERNWHLMVVKKMKDVESFQDCIKGYPNNGLKRFATNIQFFKRLFQINSLLVLQLSSGDVIKSINEYNERLEKCLIDNIYDN